MTDRNNKRNCINCEFFVSTGDILGVCKRYPQWVNKHTADWCGEFIQKARPIPVAEPVESFDDPVMHNGEILMVKRRGRPPKAKEAA